MLKPVEIHTLDVGDKFVLESYSEQLNSVYLIYEMHDDGWAECVELHSGKTFSFGRAVPVYPVTVFFGVKRSVFEKPPVDLTRKCGGCEHFSTENKEYFLHTESYGVCRSPDKRFNRALAAYRPRTTKCCKEYSPKEVRTDDCT